MLEHLRAVCRIGAGLGATRLVFGSPKNRDRSGLSDAQALEQAVSFFRRLGNTAQEHGVIVWQPGAQPNPIWGELHDHQRRDSPCRRSGWSRGYSDAV